jgi:hypothetical protein
MTTADVVREQALTLARSGVDREEAIRELESASGGRRVAAVRARQQIATSLEEEPDQPVLTLALELLDELLGRMPA